MSDRVWLATRGNYSDYRVVAAFSSQEKANAYVEAFNACLAHKMIVECVPLDPSGIVRPEGLFPWYVTMTRGSDGWAEPISPDKIEADRISPGAWVGNMYERETLALHAYILAKDEQHALKIANERRAQLIANNLWKETQP